MISHLVNTQAASMNLDRLHSIIKHFRDAFPDNFKISGMKVCLKCEGSGLPIKPACVYDSEITFWQPGSYCENCCGLGVEGIVRIYDEYLCKKCRGKGCDKCNQKGTFDWITNVVKG